MTKKEKMVMSYLCNRCQQKRTYLVSPQEITQALSKKYVLSIEEIDEIILKGSENARSVAKETMKDVKKALMINYYEK